ncbi:hypothetical protein V3C99_018429, partial [Haemonchus contortus]
MQFIEPMCGSSYCRGGRAHGLLRPYGLTGQYWEKLGEIIIDVVLGQEAVRDLPGAGQAWVIFTACLIDQMRAGFEESRTSYHLFSKREEVLGCATKHLCKSEQEQESLIVTGTKLLLATSCLSQDERNVCSAAKCSYQKLIDRSRICHISRQESVTQQGKRRPSK